VLEHGKGFPSSLECGVTVRGHLSNFWQGGADLTQSTERRVLRFIQLFSRSTRARPCPCPGSF